MTSPSNRCECGQDIFKDGACIDCYRKKSGLTTSSTGAVKHGHLSKFGKDKLSVYDHCEKVIKTYLADGDYDTTREDLEAMRDKFMEFDEDGSGDIDIGELGRAMERLGKPASQLKLRKMIEEVDSNNSGTIEFDEWVQMMLGKKSSILRLILMFEKKAAEAANTGPKTTAPPPKKSLKDLP